MGADMSPHEFIVKNVRDALIKKGVSAANAYTAANDALEFYRRTAHFKRNALDECLRYATKRAKEMGR